jgi:hypothetical protein
MSGEWGCKYATPVVAGVYRLQAGAGEILAGKSDDFRYRNLSFTFDDNSVLIRLQVDEEPKKQRVPYFRQGNYLTFSFNEGLAESGRASPITFWTNEASQSMAGYQASFPAVSLKSMKTMSGAEVLLGDGAMAVAALSCQKKTGS